MEALSEEDKNGSSSSEQFSLMCVLCCFSFRPFKVTPTPADKDEQLVNCGDNADDKEEGRGGNHDDHDHLKTFSEFCDEVITCTGLPPPTLEQFAVIKNLPCRFNSELRDARVCERDGMSVCSLCLKRIGVTMARKEKADNLECHVRSLQLEILRELRQLERILEEYNSEMGRIKEVVRGSNVECLQFQKMKDGHSNGLIIEELESGIILLRECISEGSSFRNPNFTDNISLHPPKIEAVEVKIEVDEDGDDGGPVLDFEYFPDDFDDDYNDEQESTHMVVQPRKSKRARKPVDMFIPDNFLAPVPVISQNMLDCASEYLTKKTGSCKKSKNTRSVSPGPSSSQAAPIPKPSSKSGDKAGEAKKTTGGKNKVKGPPPKNPYIAPPPRPGKCIRKKIRLKSGKLVQTAICCEICRFTTKREPAFEQHLRDHETDEDKPFQCTFCESRFTTTAYLNFHVMGHQGHYKMCCDVCLKWVPFPELLDHIKSHVPPEDIDNGPQIIFCQNCSFCCTTQEAYTKHLGKHLARMGSKEGKFKCHKCWLEYGTLGELKRHLDEEHGKLERWTCDWENCGKSYLSRSTMVSHRHMVHLNAKKEVECGECGKVFKEQCNLNAHILKYHTKDSDKPFGCTVCAEAEVELRFATKVDLKRHEMKEHGAPRYKCTVCEQEFTCKNYLKRHMQALHGNKGLTCEKCGKICLTGPQLRNHMISHSEDRNWTCEECGKGFKRRMGLKLHKRIHRGEKDWKCGYCDKAFTRKEYWVMHERTHTGEKPYVCDLCGKAFNQKTTLSIHKKNQHKEDSGEKTSGQVQVDSQQVGVATAAAICSEMAFPSVSGFT